MPPSKSSPLAPGAARCGARTILRSPQLPGSTVWISISWILINATDLPSVCTPVSYTQESQCLSCDLTVVAVILPPEDERFEIDAIYRTTQPCVADFRRDRPLPKMFGKVWCLDELCRRRTKYPGTSERNYRFRPNVQITKLFNVSFLGLIFFRNFVHFQIIHRTVEGRARNVCDRIKISVTKSPYVLHTYCVV